MSRSRLALSLVAAGLIAGTSGCGFIPGVLAPQHQGDSDDDRDDRDGEENRKESKNDDDDD